MTDVTALVSRLRSTTGDEADQAALDAIAMLTKQAAALAERDALLREIRAEWESATDRARSAHELLAERDAMLAECYRLSGADPDGNEDWRLAPRAVEEVKRLRAEADADSALALANEDAGRAAVAALAACQRERDELVAKVLTWAAAVSKEGGTASEVRDAADADDDLIALAAALRPSPGERP